MYRVVIAGGGITGLSAAYGLQQEARRAGVSVHCTLVERESRWGGKILTERMDGFVIEGGPDAILSRKPWAIELCEDLAIAGDLVPTGGRGAFIRYKQRLEPLPEGISLLVPTRLGPFVKSGLFSPWGKLRMGLEYFVPARRSNQDESLRAFVRRRLGREALEHLAEPLLSGIHAGDAGHMSVDATFPQFRRMEREYGGLLRAALAARRGRTGGTAGPTSQGENSKAAGGRGDRPESVFVSLRGGLGSLVTALVEALDGVEMIGGEAVQTLRHRSAGRDELEYGVPPRTAPQSKAGEDGEGAHGEPGVEDAAGVQGVQGAQGEGRGVGACRYEVVLAGGRRLLADAVVLAVPAYAAAALLGDVAPAAAGELAGIPYASVAGVALAYRRDEIDHPLDGTGYVVPRTAGRPVTACTWVSSKWPHTAPPDYALFRCHFGRAGGEDVTAWEDARLVTSAREELRETLSITSRPLFARVFRWERAMPQYEVGHLERLKRIDQSLEASPGVFVAGAAYRGVGVPDCVRQGTEAAEAVVTFFTENSGSSRA